MNLERSTLERKDRAELATIAETLGRKPTSRARKADIVDLILELTGVTSVGAGAADIGAAVESTPAATGITDDLPSEPDEAQGADATSTSDAAEPAAEAPAPQASRTPPGRTPRQEQGAQRSAQSRSQSETQGSQDQPAQGSGGGRQPQGERQPTQDQDGQGQEGQGQGQNGQEQPNRQSNGGQQPGGEQGEDGEGEGGSRRRRRRRGRDRDRQPNAEAEEPTTQWEGEPLSVEGLLDLRDEGYGFLRVTGYLPGREDVYVSVKQCRQLGLRRGDLVAGSARPAGRQEKNPALLQIETVNGRSPEEARNRPRFEDLTPLYPDERLELSSPSRPLDMTSRIIDLIAPIGKGQRGLIVSPPKAGKTTVMKTIAKAIEANNPEVKLIVLLVDERPEEVTDMRRSVSGEVVASTFDRPTEEHTAAAEFTIERAKRLVEYGEDVVIILDGITRLARAYNLAAPGTGRIMSGGIDTGALYPPKKFFGAARNTEEGGSLTILATALVDTGSKMDEVIFEEFKGTGNMELRLDRRMAERRIFPAIDVDASSTRHEELLFERNHLNQVWKLRRVLSGLAAEGSAGASLELLVDRMRTFSTNEQFLAEIAKAPAT